MNYQEIVKVDMDLGKEIKPMLYYTELCMREYE